MQINNPYEIFICYRGSFQESVSIGGQVHTLLTYKKNVSCFFAPYCIEKGDDFKKIIPKIMKNIKVVLLLLTKDFFVKCLDADDIVLFELQEALKNKNIKFMSVVFPEFTYETTDIEKLFNNQAIDRFKHINAIEYHTPYSFDFNSLIDSICKIKGGYVDTDNLNKKLMRIINRALGESSDTKLNKRSFSFHKSNPEAQESRLVSGDTFEIMTNSLTYDLDMGSIQMIAHSLSINAKYYYYLEQNEFVSNNLGKFINGLFFALSSDYSDIEIKKIIEKNLHIFWLPINSYPYSFTLINRPKANSIDHCSLYFVKSTDKKYCIYEVLLNKDQDLVEDLRYVFSQFKNNMPKVKLSDYYIK